LSYGLAEDNRTAVDKWQADGIVLSDEANTNINMSMIPIKSKDQVEAKEKAVLGQTAGVIQLDKKGSEKINVSFFGINKNEFLMPNIVEGKAFTNENEAVVDKSLNKENGIQLGDTIKLASNDKKIKVVGFTDNAKFNVSPVLLKAIEFLTVDKQFLDGDTTIEALKPTNVSVEKGQFVAVIGPSGSGKSTFLTLAGGLQTPTNGEVKINDEAFSQENEKQRSKIRFAEIGFILQASNLVPFLTVEKQLYLVDKVQKAKADVDKVNELLTQLGIEHLKKKYPDEISGGERQRVAIARALYNDPSIILADEPTASLDSDRAFEVVKILAKETKEKNKATIMVTHDQRLIDYCDEVFIMKDGVLEKQTS
ncbi:hypothetical protein HW555_014418, partial [Spodoptera exigua]